MYKKNNEINVVETLEQRCVIAKTINIFQENC